MFETQLQIQKGNVPWNEPLVTSSVPFLMTVAVGETDDSELSYIKIFPISYL